MKTVELFSLVNILDTIFLHETLASLFRQERNEAKAGTK